MSNALMQAQCDGAEEMLDRPLNADDSVRRRSAAERRAFALLLAAILTALAITWPVLYYDGDSFVPRAECAQWLTTGEFGIPYARRAELGELVSERGMFFFENDSRQRFFSKYGVAYTILACVPVGLELWASDAIELRQRSGSLLLILNFWNLCIAAVIVFYLWRLAALYTTRLWLRAAFVAACVFGGFLWFYLRGHNHEVIQVAAFLGFVYHATVFLRVRADDAQAPRRRSCWRSALAASLFLGVLVHMRFSYALLYVPLWAACLAAGRPQQTLGARLSANLREQRRPLLLSVFLPSAVAVGLLLFVQWWKFGSPLDHGYTQWARVAPNPMTTWPLQRVAATVRLYFVDPGNGNVFLHFPLFAVGVLGSAQFYRRRRLEACFFLAAGALVLLPVLNWGTEGHGYGPRYLLPVLVLWSLPAIEVVQATHMRMRPALRTACNSAIVAALGWAFVMQLYVNSGPYYAFFLVRDTFAPLVRSPERQQELQRYLAPPHRGLIYRDLLAYRRDGAEFLPLKWALEDAPEAARPELQQRLHRDLLEIATWNYLFLPPPATHGR